MPIDRSRARLLLVMLGLAVVFAVGSWWPAHHEQRRLSERISQAQAKLQSERLGLGDLPALVKEIGAMERELAVGPRRVPTNNDVAELLRSLCMLMDEHQLVDQQIVTQTIVSGRDYSLMPLRLEFRGLFPQVYGFLEKLESLPRMVRVMKVQVNRDTPDRVTRVQTVLELSAVFAPPREGKP